MRFGMLFSGGKDSTYAGYLVRECGHTLSCAIAIQPEEADSYLFHTPNIRHVATQAAAMELPLIEHTMARDEEEVDALENAVQQATAQHGIDGIVTGAVASTYQASRIQRICYQHGIWCINPLWQTDVDAYMRDLVRSCTVIVTAVAADGLDASWLGRELTESTLEELQTLRDKYGIHLSGEGGEFETFVVDSPLFKKRLAVSDASSQFHGTAGTYHIIALDQVST